MKPVFVGEKPVMPVWTGVEIRRLRIAKRMSVRQFASYMGISDRMVSKWEAGGRDIKPRTANQGHLDTALELLNVVELTRFCGATSAAAPPRSQTRTAPMPPPLPRREDYAARYGEGSDRLYDPNDPFWHEPRMATVLERRDIAGLYHLLQCRGLSQRRIAKLTGQAPSEVSEILSGRIVNSYEVLERIVGGLGIPRGRMGLAYGLAPSPSDPAAQ